jgi:hypothetical protein
MIHDEVVHAMAASGKDYPIEWIEEGLHSSIAKLHDRIQQAFDAVGGAEDSANTAGDVPSGGVDGAVGTKRILLAFGVCGNMVDGLVTHDFEVIMPNVDDCVSLMLYPHKDGKTPGVFYLTRGWMNSGKNAWNDWAKNAERFGEKKADRIMKVMMDSYRSMSVVDTGAYPVGDIWESSLERAERLGLAHGSEKGSTKWIEQLLTGPYDGKFLQFGAHETIHVDLLGGPTQ